MKKILHEKSFKLKLSGNEAYSTACSLLVTLKNSCSQLHCQKSFDLILFSDKIRLGVLFAGCRPRRRIVPHHPGDNPGANRWFLESTPIQMLPPEGSICGKLTSDLPLGCLKGGLGLKANLVFLELRVRPALLLLTAIAHLGVGVG